MAEVNYVSPAGMQPKLGWTPDGFLGGYLYGDQERDYKNTLGLSQLSSALGVQDQQNKLHEYGLNDVVRNAERAANVATADATTQTVLPSKLAGIAAQNAQTRASNASTDTSNINNMTLQRKNLSELDTSDLKNRAEKLKQVSQIAQQAMFMGPAARAYVEQEASKIGLPEKYFDAMLSDPAGFSKKLAEASEGYIKAIAEQELKNKGVVEAVRARPQPATNPRLFSILNIAKDYRDKNPNASEEESIVYATEQFNAQTAGAGKPFTPFEIAQQQQYGNQMPMLNRRLQAAIDKGDAKEVTKIMKELSVARQISSSKSQTTRAKGGEEIIKIPKKGP